jgi:chromosome segregation ATPase
VAELALSGRGSRRRRPRPPSRRGRVAQAEKALAELRPAWVKPGMRAIVAALAEQDKASAEAETLNATVASLRKQLDELEPLVAQSGQAIAGLQARAAQLLEEAGAAEKEGDRAMTGLRKLAGEGEWKDVLALIDQKQNPQARIASMHKDAVAEADTLTARKTSLEERVRVIEQKIERAGELRESLEAARVEGALGKELGLLLSADQFQDFVVSSAI